MSEINSNNYEAYMLDFFEGKLSNEQIIALKAFAVLHPELDLNFDEELVELENETISFSNKQNLKVNFNDELVIGYLENTLTDKEKKEADALAKTNAVFIKELNLYKKTVAQPDERIVFENKSQLKREPKIIFFSQTTTLRVAAAILLLFGLWFLITNLFTTTPITTPELAKIELKNSTKVSSENENKVEQLNQVDKQLAVVQKTNPNKTSKKTTLVQTVQPSTLTSASSTVNSTTPDNNENANDDQKKITYIDTNALKLNNALVSEKTQRKFIIEEEADNDDAVVVNAPKKGKLWNMASKALRSLNKNGIEKVNSSDNTNDLFIGALTITKND